jgi:hypothetical protein
VFAGRPLRNQHATGEVAQHRGDYAYAH